MSAPEKHQRSPSDSSSDNRPRVDVAVAVVFNSSGQVLWGSRPAGKPYAGYWEFPGGKLEPGESVWQALVRELKEELGITALEGGPWFVIEHDYEHAKVRLHLYRVWRFEGQPECLEGQTVAWGQLSTDEVSPILPATAPLLPVLAQPEILGLTQYGVLGLEGMQSLLDRAQARCAGHFRVLFREKSLDTSLFIESLKHCLRWCESHGVECLINSSSALQWLQAGQTWPLQEQSGSVLGNLTQTPVRLHLTSSHLHDLPTSLAGLPVAGASVHNVQELEAAHQAGLDYAMLGSVCATQTHPDQVPLGWARFRDMTELARMPVFAVGGLGLTELKNAQKHGAHGVAMIRGFEFKDCKTGS